MKFIIIFFTVAALCAAVDKTPSTKQPTETDVNGSYKFEYESGHDTALDDVASKSGGAQKRFSYKTPEGRQIEIVYEADGSDEPQKGSKSTDSPPSYVLRALEYIKTHPPKEE